MAYRTVHTNYGLQKIAESEASGTVIKLDADAVIALGQAITMVFDQALGKWYKA